MASRHEIVLVTGGTGFIALHLVKQLLESGRTVHATVRSLANEKRNAPLVALGAPYPDKLKLFEADLTGESSQFDAALAGGVQGVFHTASPCFLAGVTGENAEEKLVKPALHGTLCVLEAAARQPTVKRVVVTSSFATIVDPRNTNKTYTEADWNTDSKASDGGVGSYRYSKVAAERAAWDFVEKNKPGFDLITINPPFVLGENIAPVGSFEELNTSSQIFMQYLTGTIKQIPDGGAGLVDATDVARAHVLAMDTPEASGRFLVSGGQMTFNEIAATLKELFPAFPVPTVQTNPDAGKPVLDATKSIQVFGMNYHPAREILRIQGEDLIRKGLVSPPA